MTWYLYTFQLKNVSLHRLHIKDGQIPGNMICGRPLWSAEFDILAIVILFFSFVFVSLARIYYI